VTVTTGVGVGVGVRVSFTTGLIRLPPEWGNGSRSSRKIVPQKTKTGSMN
jgi:hypothetical protein